MAVVTPRKLAGDVTGALRRSWAGLLTWHLFFLGLIVAVVTPASAWVLRALVSTSGQPMVSNEQIVRFILSPAGLAWLLGAGTVAVMVVFIQHAGMMTVASAQSAGRYRTAATALGLVLHRLPRLVALAAMHVGMHLLVAAPFLAAVAVLAVILLADYDPYYLLTRRPPVLWGFLAAAVPLVMVMAVCNGWLYLRWVLSLPVLLLEGHPPRPALRRSSELTRGHRLRVAVLVVGTVAIVATMPLGLSLLFERGGVMVLGLLPERLGVLMPAAVGFLATYIVFAFAVTFLGVSANSLLIYHLYRRITDTRPDPGPATAGRGTGWLAWSSELAVLAFAIGQAVWVMHSFDFEDRVTISAHRGASLAAPENTLPAIEKAIAAGSDYIEIDVRQTADGRLVLLHDRDLRRVAGVSRDVWDMRYEELAELDVGSWFDPRFAGTRIATLEEAIEAVRGRAKLYLEIKPSRHSPDLTRNVIATLQRHDFIDQTLLAALDASVLHEAAALAPDLRRVLLVHTAIGRPTALDLHAVSKRAALVTPATVIEAHRRGHEIHVWTVNRREQMSRFIDMGVDSIITDHPQLLADLLHERSQLSDAELFLIKLRNWLGG